MGIGLHLVQIINFFFKYGVNASPGTDYRSRDNSNFLNINGKMKGIYLIIELSKDYSKNLKRIS